MTTPTTKKVQRLTKQGYYNLLVKSATDGTFPSYGIFDGDNTCLYQKKTGQRCAVGVLFPEGVEFSKKENCAKLCHLSSEKKALIFSRAPIGTTDHDLIEIQQNHDRLTKNGKRSWSAYQFIMLLNSLEYFAKVKKVIPDVQEKGK
jgi:hypothetical protein